MSDNTRAQNEYTLAQELNIHELKSDKHRPTCAHIVGRVSEVLYENWPGGVVLNRLWGFAQFQN